MRRETAQKRNSAARLGAIKGQCDEKGSNKVDSAARLGAIKGQCDEIGSNKGTVQREREQ